MREDRNLKLRLRLYFRLIRLLYYLPMERMSKTIEISVYDLQELRNENKRLEEENKKLKEEVRFLEECLDRKEKLNEKYRKELEELKSTYVYDAKQVRDIC